MIFTVIQNDQLHSNAPNEIARTMGLAVIKMSQDFAMECPDFIIIRECSPTCLSAAVTACAFCIPVVRVENTTKPEDMRYCYSIDKLSHLFFVHTGQYERRLLQMGESRWRVVRSETVPSISQVIDVINKMNLPKHVYIWKKFQDRG
jgi:UDP-N-acetylglucosamine 2-epimerase